MDFPSIINRLLISVCSVCCLLAIVFLLIVITHWRQCFNFPTLLACNTALAVLVFAADNLAVSCYMFIWDQQQKPIMDILCPFRAYIHHSALACIHHTLLLQAIQRYCNIKTIKLLDSKIRKIFLVIIQWIFDFTFVLPILLTGNMTKLSLDNMCLISLSKPYLLGAVGVLSFFSSDITMIVLYRGLIKYVRAASLRSNVNHEKQMRRDLTMVRRIILLNGQVVILTLPAIILLIIASPGLEHLIVNYFRILLLVAYVSPCFMLTVLFWITPNLRNIVYERFRFLKDRLVTTATMRVTPFTEHQNMNNVQDRFGTIVTRSKPIKNNDRF